MKDILDISSAQTIVDMEKLRATVGGIIIKLGYTGYGSGKPAFSDGWKAHINNLKTSGIPLGVYYFTLATTEAMVDMETDWIIAQLKEVEADGFRFTLPIWVDCESQSNGTFGKNWMSLTADRRSQLMKRWMNNLRAAGYYTGIYAGVRGYHRTPYFVSKAILQGYDKWTAQYNSVCQWDGVAGVDYHMWQFTSSGKGEDYGLKAGQRVDVSHCYVEYPTIIMDGEYNGNIKCGVPTTEERLKVTIGDDEIIVPKYTTVKVEVI